jgi:carbamoyltransferase
MGLALGIHVGHDASCALVRDGELVAAIQLERLSRKKHHAVESLWNGLPIQAVLDCVGATMDDVDVIVSCFQAGSPGGFGLHRALVEPSFSVFDPFADRHHVMSHHLAHAYCAAAYAPRGDVAVVVSDYAGSSTVDGDDFFLRFRDWYRTLVGSRRPVALQTESLSIYRARLGEDFSLVHREFRTPHNAPESAVSSVASLYENVTQAVFRRPNTHGSLMALAAYGDPPGPDDRPMVDVDGEEVVFRNDWQHAVYDRAIVDAETGDYRLSRRDVERLARRCQEATEEVVLAYARRATRLTGARHLALGGGTFLNILANSRLAASGLFDTVSLPSAPHDAGIAIGCAFRGAVMLGHEARRVVSDRLGPRHTVADADAAILAAEAFVTARQVGPAEVAERIHGGAIVARCAGRSEFGPRALGGRSLLASPLRAESKTRLNVVKGREPWRPVAPVVSAEHLAYALEGPAHSPWMTFSHAFVGEHGDRLAALAHPDGSTRAQTLARVEDPWLDDLLHEFGRRTGYHILVNTSFNGPAEPIIESPREAIDWFLRNGDVDALLLEDRLIERKDVRAVLETMTLRPNPGVLVVMGGGGTLIKLGPETRSLSSPALVLAFSEASFTLADLEREDPSLDLGEVWALVVRGLLLRSEP